MDKENLKQKNTSIFHKVVSFGNVKNDSLKILS